jgi:hypothetical protein
MLMASLPPLGDLFDQQQTPLSELKLQQRLKLLTEQDRTTLARIEQLLRRSKQPKEWTDAQIVKSAKVLVNDLKSPALKEAVEFVMNVRTIGVAFRRRRLGQNAPPPERNWGYSRWIKRIENHWTEADFGLATLIPWIPQAVRLWDTGDPIELERFVLVEAWKQFSRLSQGHYFDFPAVVLYVLRWSLINRRVNYNRDIALKRFKELINDGIGNFRELFPARTN